MGRAQTLNTSRRAKPNTKVDLYKTSSVDRMIESQELNKETAF
jgi:hypothetical protein